MVMVLWIYRMRELMMIDFDLKLTKENNRFFYFEDEEDLQRLKSKEKYILIKLETNFDLDCISFYYFLVNIEEFVVDIDWYEYEMINNEKHLLEKDKNIDEK
jgi:hypothetical protein